MKMCQNVPSVLFINYLNMNTALNIHVPISIEKDLNELILGTQTRLNELKTDYGSVTEYEKSLFKGNGEPIDAVITKLKEYEKAKFKHNSLENLKMQTETLEKCFSETEMGIYRLKELITASSSWNGIITFGLLNSIAQHNRHNFETLLIKLKYPIFE
jgi:hypothetical protein